MAIYAKIIVNSSKNKNVLRMQERNKRLIIGLLITFEPRHDKTNKMSVRPAKTDQPGHRAYWVAKDPSFLHADSEDSDQTGRMPRLI